MSHTLTYGDIIRIYCSFQNIKEGNKTGGFLMSKGFADTNIYFLKSKQFTEFELRNSLFEVLPYSSFEIHDEAKKKKEQAKVNKKKLDLTENTKSSMKTQQEQFKSKIMKQKKMEINFDSEVVIKHVNSDGYLQGEFSCPQTGIGSFKLILSSELSSDVKFKITRFRNSDKQAQKIQSKDQFILYHCTSHCYLNIGDIDQKVFLDKQIRVQSKQHPPLDPMQIAKQDKQAHKIINQRPLIKQPNQSCNKRLQRHEVVNMSKPTLILNFLLEKSSRDQQIESEIRHNDVIFIKNTQNQSYLTADLWSGDVSLVSYTGSKSGNFPYQGIWEVSVPRDTEKGQVSNIKNYFLKHYVTDKIVSVINSGSHLKRLKLHDKMTFNAPIKTVKVVNYKQTKILNHRDLVFLKTCQSDTQAVLNPSEKNTDKNTSHEFLDIGHKTQKIFRTKLQQKIDEDSTNYNMQITKGPLVNAFQIFKLQQNKLKQVNKILSCVQILTNFCDVLIVLDNLIRKKIVNGSSVNRQTNLSQQSENHNNTTIKSDFDIERFSRIDNKRTSIQGNIQPSYQDKIQKFLNQYLNYYILNLVIQTIEYLFTNIKKPSKKPDFPLMMMIKSLGLIQILVQAIFFIERNQELIKRGDTSTISDYLKKKKYLRDRLEDCFKKIYQLLFELSQENSCRLYLGKWFGMFMNQFYSLRSDYIHVLIIALLKEKLIMKSLIDLDIQKCIQNMTAKQIMNSNKSYKYLELLSSFCRAKNTVVPKNQKFIIKKLKNYPDLFYKFSTHDASKFLDQTQYLYAEKNQLYYKKKQEQGLLQNFQDDDKWSYIIFLLNLYADLIFDHSYQKMKEFRQFISMDTVKAFFIKKDITQKNDSSISIVDSFLKLTHYFFLNQLNQSISPTLYVDRQQTIYIVNNIQPLDNYNHFTDDIFKQYQDVVYYIMQQILSRKKFREQKQYKVSKLKTMQTSLDFIKAISRIQDNDKMTDALKLIIQVVIQLKRSVVYINSQNVIEQLMTLKTEKSEGMPEEEFVSKKDEAVKKVDDSIDKNIKKLLFEKPLERLLIDTRSIAGQILEIRLNLLINRALGQLNAFFVDVCDNNAHIQHYNRARNSEIFVSDESSHWIWINKIVEIVDYTINQNINLLVFNKKKTTLVKLLIQCIFVSSLKITNKIMMLIFRMYELRKTLMTRFKDTFIIVKPCFKQICQFNMKWISDFQKIKIGGNYDTLLIDLQLVSMMIRFYDNEQKNNKIKQLLNLKNQNQDYNEKKKELKQLNIGMSNYLVFNETETCLSTDQILLQNMIGNQKIHSYVLSYIKTLTPGVKNYDQHLDIAYEFLTLLVYNNRKNKKVLTKQIKVTLSHITSNYRAIEFLKKTIIENQNIINNKQLVALLVQAILQGAHSVDGDEEKIIIKAKLIQALRVFCVFEGKNHTENQSYIMIQLQNKKYDKSLMFSTSEYKRNKNLGDEGMFIIQQLYNIGRQDHLLKAIGTDNPLDSSYEEASEEGDSNSNDFKKYPKILNDFVVYRKRFNKLIEKKTGNNNYEQSMVMNTPDEEQSFQVEGDNKAFKINIPGNILYLSAYFSTMSALVEGGHQINKGKCCNIHPFESLLQFIQDSTKCYPLLRHLRAYFIKLYFYNFMQKKSTTEKGTTGTKQHSLTLSQKISSIQTANAGGRQNLKDFEYLMNRLFGKQINLLIDRLKCINTQLLDQENQDYKIVITTPIRYKYLQSYMLGLLQQILYQINVFFQKVNEFISIENEEIIRKQKKISKQESHSLKQIIKLLGTTYQLVTKLQKDSTVKKLIKNIFKRSMNIIKIVDLGNDQILDFVDVQKKVDEKTKQSEDFKELSRELSKKKERLYKFMLYYFFLSYQDEKGITLINTQAIKHEDHNNASVSPQNDLKNSFIKRLLPKKVLLKKDSIQKKKEFIQQKQLIKQLQNHTQQTRINKLLQIITQDLVQRQQAGSVVKQELDQLVKLCCDLDQIQTNDKQDESQINSNDLQNSNNTKQNKQFRIIGYNKFMTDIITLVTKSPAHLTLQGKIKTIRLIRLIFQRKVNILCKIENKQWQSGFFQQQKLKMLKQIQHQFKKIDLDKMIVAILKEENISYRLLLQTFKLGIKFLYNGNSQCQAAILNNLKQDSENKVMVALFNFIKKMRWEISQGKFVIKKQVSEQNVDKFKPFIIDTFHYFDRNNKCLDQLGAEKDNSKEFEEQIQHKIKCVCKAYQFLQLLCQNDNQIAKNFLRLQTNQNGYPKYNSINFVSETSKLFKVVLQNYDPKEHLNSILQYLADFFIEVTQLPCTENQLELCSTSIFSDIRYYAINSNKFDKQISNIPGKSQKSGNSNKSNVKFQQTEGPQKPMCYLMDFVVNAGLSLLQGSSNQIYKALILFFDKQFVYQIFRYQREVLVVLNKKNPQCPLIHEFNDDTLKILLNQNPQDALIKKRIYMIFNLFALVQKLSKYAKQHKYQLNQSGTLIEKLTKYAQEQDLQQQKRFKADSNIVVSQPSSQIIMDFCKKLKHIQVVFQQKKQYIYFPDLPIFKKLSNQTKQNILQDIKRDSQVDKITDFIMKSPEINNLMNWNYKVEDRLSLETGTLQNIRFNILSLTFVIVGMYIFFTTITFVQIKGKPHMLKTFQNPFIDSIVNTLCVLHLFSSIYFVFTWCTLKYRMPIQKQLKRDCNPQLAKLLSKIDNDEAFEKKDYWTCLTLIFKHQQTQAIPILIFFIIFSFSGYFFGIEWYSVLIFDMVTRNKILKNVIQAITSNLQQLLVVSLLILAFVYVFNIISIQFSLYLPLIFQQQDDKCTVLSDCVISLYTSGQIGQKHKDFKFIKFLADLLYVVIMQLLFSNIVSGIVIDTFAQLRDQRKTIQTDTQTICFICGISKGTLQKQLRQQQQFSVQNYSGTKRFQKHIQQVHSQWDYIYYLYILSQKDITTYSGIQYFIKKQTNNDQYDWIPRYEQDQDKQIKQILEVTQRLVPKIKQKLNNRNELIN